MSDEFKLSVDVEANLSKLDSSLNMAVQKVARAGQTMQNSLGFFGSSSPIAGAISGGSAPVPGQPMSFGGSLNANAGNAFAPNYRIPDSFWSQPSASTMRLAGLASSLGSYSRLGLYGGLAAGAAAGHDLLTSGFESGQDLIASRARGDRPGEVSAAGKLQEQSQSLFTLSRYSTFAKQAAGTYVDLSVSGEALRSAREISQKATTYFGGYKSQLSDLDYERDVNQQKAIDDATIKFGSGEAVNKLTYAYQRLNEAKFKQINSDRRVNLNTIRNNIKASALRSAGLELPAQLSDIDTSFMESIAQANLQGDTELSGLLKQSSAAAKVQAVLSGTQTGAEISPGYTAVGPGAVIPGTMSGQDPGYQQYILNIMQKIANNTANTTGTISH